jgi:hypothetical protein
MRSAQHAGSRGVFGDMASLVKHLPHYQAPATLILLKGHLLVEELLRGNIDRRLPNPSSFEHNRFSFAQALILCRALASPKLKSWGFDAAEKLNNVRNEVAHELESSDLKRKLEIFVELVEQNSKGSVFPTKERGESRLYVAIADLHNELIRVFHGKAM